MPTTITFLSLCSNINTDQQLKDIPASDRSQTSTYSYIEDGHGTPYPNAVGDSDAAAELCGRLFQYVYVI